MPLKKDPSPGGPTTDGSIIYTDQHNEIVDRLGGEADLTANRALATDANGDLQVSAVTSTQLGYLNGVTSAIQTQLDSKQFTFMVAANDANSTVKAMANYECDGIDDDVQIQAAITALPVTGGRIVLSEGTFNISAEINLASNVCIEGQGNGTVIQLSGLVSNGNAFTTNVTQSDTTAYNIGDVTRKDSTVTLDTGTEEDNFTVGDYVALNTSLVIDAADPTKAFQGDYYRVTSVTNDDTGVIGLDEYALEDYANTPTLTVVDFIQNVSLKNFKITDSTADEGKASQGNAQAMYMLYVDGLNIDNVNFDGVFTAAVQARACLNVKITNCNFVDIKRITSGSIHYGVHVLTGRGFLIDNCTFKNTRHAVTTNATGLSKSQYGYNRDVTVSNCVSMDSTQAHYDTHQGSKGVVFTNLTATGYRSLSGSSPNGIQCRSPVAISNCEIQSIANIGIRVTDDNDHTTLGGSGTTISNCRIHDVDEGIFIDEFMEDVVITGCQFYNLESEAIQALSIATVVGCKNLVITSNYIETTGTSRAIRIDSCADVLIQDNRAVCSNWLQADNTEGTACTGLVQNNFITGGGAESGTLTGIVFSGNKGTGSTHITIDNEGAGSDPELSANDASQKLTITGSLEVSAGLEVTSIQDGDAFQRIRTTSAGTSVEWFTERASIPFVVDGGGSAITQGKKGQIIVPFDCQIIEWHVLADQSGSIVVDVNHSTYANFPTTASIAGSELPTLSSAQKNQDTSLTTWTGSGVVSAGDVLEFEVDSATTVTRVSVNLIVEKRG